MDENVPDATGTDVRAHAELGRTGQGTCMHNNPGSFVKRANCADTRDGQVSLPQSG